LSWTIRNVNKKQAMGKWTFKEQLYSRGEAVWRQLHYF